MSNPKIIQPFLSPKKPLSFWMASSLLILFFVITRLFNLTMLPIFVDEGLHIIWSQQMIATKEIFQGTAAGKFLYIWLLTPFIGWNNNPFDGRFLSSIISFFNIIATIYLGHVFWPDKKLKWIIGSISLFLPLILWHERLALVDGLLMLLTTLILILSIKLTSQKNTFLSSTLGLCLGLVYLTKLSGIFYFIIPIICFVILQTRQQISIKRLWLAYAIAFILALPTAPDTFNQLLNETASRVINPAGQHISALEWRLYSLGQLWLDLATYVTWPILFFAMVPIIFGIYKKERQIILLTTILLITPIPYIILARDFWYSRYLLPMAPLIIILAAYAINHLAQLLTKITPFKHQQIWVSGLCLLALLPSLYFDYLLLTSPQKAPLTPVDRWQYIVGWPAGYGLAESLDWLEQRVEADGPVTVMTTHHSGPTQEGLRLYLQNRPVNLNLVSLDLQKESGSHIRPLIQDDETPTLLLLNEPVDQVNDLLQSLCPDVLAIFPKPENQSRLVIKNCPAQPSAITTQSD